MNIKFKHLSITQKKKSTRGLTVHDLPSVQPHPGAIVRRSANLILSAAMNFDRASDDPHVVTTGRLGNLFPESCFIREVDDVHFTLPEKSHAIGRVWNKAQAFRTLEDLHVPAVIPVHGMKRKSAVAEDDRFLSISCRCLHSTSWVSSTSPRVLGAVDLPKILLIPEHNVTTTASFFPIHKKCAHEMRRGPTCAGSDGMSSAGGCS